GRPPRSHIFPYSTLFRSRQYLARFGIAKPHHTDVERSAAKVEDQRVLLAVNRGFILICRRDRLILEIDLFVSCAKRRLEQSFLRDRKSTRLNSSHVKTSY